LGAHSRRVDAYIESYVEWREECGHLQYAYQRWTGSGRLERDLAFAAYRAALDREEKAARAYELLGQQVAVGHADERLPG